MKMIDRLWTARKGSPQADRLDVLATLVESWEEKHFPMLPPDPIEAIKFRMEQDGLDNADLAKIVGGRNRVSEILRGKRGLSLEMIRNLHLKLRIPAESLIARSPMIE
ncbi:MAG: helix-turn-helix domain-containing protein [bacterium]